MNESEAAPRLKLRPARAEDEQFLFEVYSATRAGELAQVGWDKTQLEFFLRMQFNLQQRFYDGIEQQIILVGEERVGRLIVIRSDEEVRLADIALLPECRGAGAGTALVKELMLEAETERKPLRLQVEKTNSGARRLYERLGFKTTGESDTHFRMEYLKTLST